MVALKASHIQLDNSIVSKVFQNIHYAYVAYAKAQNRLLITPVSSKWFVKMYEPTQFLLKDKNLKGDKSIAVREILIDNNIEQQDRPLNFEVVEKTNLIKIQL
ncbi:MAG: hypothetical protein HRU50_12480 [Winogradskyella sp.]|uniref:hypothetical protein n=1 Tax=Winogradskyella sp. TaxID=1883156 RepID=UPI0025D54CA2|nr:hypothetical protein [Winogradskyella sp.]NRB60740.1 hypothetical protein [Winogradskyella sp.]